MSRLVFFDANVLLCVWDALIVQAARNAGARVIYTEDWQPGQTIGNIRVVNPFL
jgi:predicted nucleic acid-binding protein